ncbi:MAG: patatin-like phospholipase family protein [Solirubrobacterales bacterium]
MSDQDGTTTATSRAATGSALGSGPGSEKAGGRLLGSVPVLAGLSEEQRGQLAKQAREVAVAAGEWLLREGEEGETMYVIRSGQLDIVSEGPPETLIRTIRRGDVVGELALLHAERRSASVRARRNSELLELSRSQFEQLIRKEPSFAIALTRSMGAQLAVSKSPVGSPPAPRAIAVVRLDSRAPGPEAVDRLAKGLRRAGSLARLDPRAEGSKVELLGAIERAEDDAERVLLVAGGVAETWTELCLGEADIVVAITSGQPDREWSRRASTLKGCELLVTGGESVSESWLAALEPRELQVLTDPDRLGAALDSTARRLTGRAWGVVLSGGGARAFAHLGVIEVLLEAGLVIDRVGGVSLGGLVAGAVATGAGRDTLHTIFKEGIVERNPTGDYALPLYALLRGNRTRGLLAEHFGEQRIEELPMRFFCLSCDLVAREAVVHRSGVVHEAVYASLAIPAVFPPVATQDGRLLVDGGVLDNLPVATMAATGQGPVVASDVTGQMGAFRRPARRRLAKLTRPLRRALTGTESELPRLGETILRTVVVGSTDTVAAARQHADIVITPQVDGVGLMDWKRIDEVREMGRRTAQEALEKMREIPWAG